MSLIIEKVTSSESQVLVPQKKEETALISSEVIAQSASSTVSSTAFSLVERVKAPKVWTDEAEKQIEEALVDCTSEQIQTFDALIQSHKGQLNEISGINRSTIFHELAKYGAPLPFVSVLLKHGADNGVQDDLGDTPLMWAIANAHNSMANEILIKLPFSQARSLDKQCSLEGNTALHLLIAKGYKDLSFHEEPLAYSNFALMKSVLALGANVNLADTRGNTPLHLAYARRDVGMVKCLLDFGANRDAVNEAGQKPKDLAILADEVEVGYAKADAILTASVDVLHVLDKSEYTDPSNLKTLLAL